MDYNTHSNCWTPCQIGKIHRNLADKKYPVRPLLLRKWCRLNPNHTITIRDSIDWNGAKDLEGHIVIEDGGVLTIRCRISLPKGAKITVYPKGSLILDGGKLENDCGDQWQGIEVMSKGKDRGKVVFSPDAVVEHAEHAVQVISE